MTSTPAATPPPRDTHIYKRADDGRVLEADVIGAVPGGPVPGKPCVVWIHGGGLIFGSRKISPRPPFLLALLERGFVVVSIDHRLAPETQLPGIVEDVRDAWRWVLNAGPARFGIDPRRVALAGASAGAYLALMGAHSLHPPPRAVASFWGFGDITAPWEAEPSAHYRQMEHVTREQALASLSAPPVSDPAVGIDRSVFYLYCRQQGRWLAKVTGHDPHTDDAWFNAYCPLRNVSAGFPPTALVHGTADTDVPHSESAQLAARLAAAGVPHRFISLEGIGHGFAGALPKAAVATEAEMANFLGVHCTLQDAPGAQGSTKS